MHSFLFRGATVVDGSGNPGYQAGVALAGDRIAEVGPRIAGKAAKVIDAEGLVLAPGFIDIHSHTDTTIFKHPAVESKAFQGVTLEVVGNCGLGVFPVDNNHLQELSDFLRLHEFHIPGNRSPWNDFATY